MVGEIDDGFLAGWSRLTCSSGWWCQSVKYLDLLLSGMFEDFLGFGGVEGLYLGEVVLAEFF